MSTNSIAMTNDLFHIRLREARLLCGLSMDKLAAKPTVPSPNKVYLNMKPG